jgi:hypothetical protein
MWPVGTRFVDRGHDDNVFSITVSLDTSRTDAQTRRSAGTFHSIAITSLGNRYLDRPARELG